MNLMIIKHTDLHALRKRNRDKKIVVGSGVFDLLHVGHVAYLQNLKNYGDIVVVIVKPDARVKNNKHKTRPIIPEQDRARMVDSVKGVDYVIIGSYDPQEEADTMYRNVFDLLKPDVFVTSNDEWGKLQEITDASVQVLPREQVGRFESTTAVIEYIKKID